MRYNFALIVGDPGPVLDELAALVSRVGYFYVCSSADDAMSKVYNAPQSIDVLVLTSADSALVPVAQRAINDLLLPPWCQLGVLRTETPVNLGVQDRAVVVLDTQDALKNLLEREADKAVKRPLALLVEDDDTFGMPVRRQLWEKGVSVFHARHANEAIEVLPTLSKRLDLAIVDLKLQTEVNGGWRVIAELGLLTWADWCRIAVVTAYDVTRQAAEALGLNFFHKDTPQQVTAFLNFLDDEVDKALKRRNRRRGPDVLVERGVEEPSYQETMACKAVSSAEQVVIKGRPKGSLQGGAMVTAEIHPNDGGAKYEGVVKCGDASKIDRELNGYALLSQYFRDIGSFIPPPKPYPSLLTQAEKVVVTPWVRGKTLYEIVQTYCVRDANGWPELMNQVLQRLRTFLTGIRTLVETTHSVDYIIQKEYFDPDNPDVSRRLAKALGVLTRCIGEEGRVLNIDGAGLEVVNPRWVLEHEKQIRWKKASEGCWEARYAHGDFHAGNVLVDVADVPPLCAKDVFVLDYDYVGARCIYFDYAQMETSLWMAVSMDKRMQTEECWGKKLRPVILALVSPLNTGDDRGIDDSWARKMVEVIRYWRSGIAEQERLLYDACLFATMLRIFTSHYLKEHELDPICVRSALSYLGLLLNGLVETSGRPAENSNGGL